MFHLASDFENQLPNVSDLHNLCCIPVLIDNIRHTLNAVAYLQWGLVGHVPQLTFSLFNVILNKHVAYLSCSYYTLTHNLEVVAALCSRESLFAQGVYRLQYKHPCTGETSALRLIQKNIVNRKGTLY